MKVVGLSGAQGGGKSSLLAELENRGWNVDKFRVSRAVQAQLGWDKLDNVMLSWETMTQFQTEVLKQKYLNDSNLIASVINTDESIVIQTKDDIILTERTFADIAAYTSMWTWNHIDNATVKFDDALHFKQDYISQCATAQYKIYNATILLPYMSDVMIWEDDPNRAKLKDVERIYEDIVRFLERKLPITHKRVVLSAKNITDRATQVENFLTQNWI
jgi:predicted ATPase